MSAQGVSHRQEKSYREGREKWGVDRELSRSWNIPWMSLRSGPGQLLFNGEVTVGGTQLPRGAQLGHELTREGRVPATEQIPCGPGRGRFGELMGSLPLKRGRSPLFPVFFPTMATETFKET